MSIIARIWKRAEVIRAVVGLVVAIIVAVFDRRLVG